MRTIQYQPKIDGLRAIAVLSVVFYHLKISSFGGGFIGVDIFFVISGYLITSIILSEKEKGIFDLKKFLLKRIKRLLPAIIFVSIFTALLGFLILSPDDLKNFSRSIISSIFFVSNILYWTESNYFNTVSEFKPFLHTWSLGVEMTFYLVWPIILIFLIKFFKTTRIILFLIITSIISIVFIEYIFTKGLVFETTFLNGFFYGKYISDTLFYNAPFRFYEFFFVCILCFVPKKDYSNSTNQCFFVLGLILIIGSALILNNNSKIPGISVVPAILGTSLVLFFNENNFLKRILINKLMIGIGLISYSLYLVHWPLISLYKYYNLGTLVTYDKVLILSLSFLISILMYFFIEKPWRFNYSKNKKYLSIIISIIILGFSFVVINQNGFVNRLSETEKELFHKLKTTAQDKYCKPQKSIFKNVIEKICVTGDESSADIILMGDSNAMMWYKPFSNFSEKYNYNFVNYSRICKNFPHPADFNYFLNKDFIFKDFNNCSEITTNAKILIIGNAWFNYQFSEFNTEIVSGYINNINLIKNNKNFKNIEKILVLGQIPAFESNNLDITSCLTRPKFFKKEISCKDYYKNTFKKNNFLEKIKDFNLKLEKQINDKLSKNYKVLFIDPTKNLCIKNDCKQISEKNDFFYKDSNHISNFGANYIYNKNKPLIEKFLVN
jgi:peptidoglycan/LPS O-acetylase OafA/YrhL